MEMIVQIRSLRWHYAWVVLMMGTLVVFGALGMARFGYSFLLPPMQVSLGMNNTQAGILATANLIGYLALSVIGGALATRYGPRIVVAIALALVGIGMLFTGVVSTFLPAVFWRAVTGVGSGASNVPAMGLVGGWFAARRRGFATGVAAMGSSLGLILIGTFIPRVLTAYGEDGWRISWYIFGVTTLVLSLLAWLLLRNDPSEVNQGRYGESPDLAEPRLRSTVIHWGSIYKASAVWHLGLVYVAFGFSYIIYMTFFVKRLIAEGGYSQEAAGNLFMTMGWFSLICGLIWGAVSDVIGRKWAMMLVYIVQALAFITFALAANSIAFTVSAILFGLTAWSIPTIMAATCNDVLGAKMAPAALGFITLFFGIGQAVGPSVAGVMADASGTFSPAYLLAGGVALLGALGASLLKDSSVKGDG
jgi:MFS family permease